LHILALVSLELDHLSHLSVVDDGAIAGKLLLDDLENLLLVEFLGQTLNSGQSLTSITFCTKCQPKDGGCLRRLPRGGRGASV
jgi:hypothetical protein